ncbi:MAG TPA: hypothetical protein QF730_03760 [Planctomycetota bacterium]|nr:hypothetical protein [Planctomycetota bacterium]
MTREQLLAGARPNCGRCLAAGVHQPSTSLALTRSRKLEHLAAG